MAHQILHFVVGPVATNCYFLVNDATGEALVIDPGASGKALARQLKEKELVPKAILLTHGHFDHTDGIADLLEEYGGEIPVYAYEGERETLEDPGLNLSANMGGHRASYHADVFVRDGEVLSLAGFEIQVLFTPGHTPGGCCYYVAQEKLLFSGDSLFCGSIGRTDFPRGSMSDLVRGIREKLLVLPEEVAVYTGHDSPTTIGDEKRYNPYLQ